MNPSLAEQDVNETANRRRSGRERDISSKCQVKPLRKRLHTFRQNFIQIGMFIFKSYLCDHAQLLAKLVLDPSPKRDGAICT